MQLHVAGKMSFCILNGTKIHSSRESRYMSWQKDVLVFGCSEKLLLAMIKLNAWIQWSCCFAGLKVKILRKLGFGFFFFNYLTEVLNNIASKFVLHTMCLVGVQMIFVELLTFPVTNILYSVKHNANTLICEYMSNSLVPRVGELVVFFLLEDALLPWNKLVFLYCDHCNPWVRLLLYCHQ